MGHFIGQGFGNENFIFNKHDVRFMSHPCREASVLAMPGRGTLDRRQWAMKGEAG